MKLSREERYQRRKKYQLNYYYLRKEKKQNYEANLIAKLEKLKKEAFIFQKQMAELEFIKHNYVSTWNLHWPCQNEFLSWLN